MAQTRRVRVQLVQRGPNPPSFSPYRALALLVAACEFLLQ
jgi:hypothetical protein